MSKEQGQRMHWTQIKCPFFHRDDRSSIICEGCTENASVRQTFPNKAARWAWEKKYCMGIHECELCPLYKAANEKY